MIRRIAALMTACLYLFTVSCGTSTKMVSPGAIKAKDSHISAVALKTGEIIEFDGNGARLDKERKEVSGTTKDGKNVRIPFTDIMTATVQHKGPGEAIALVGLAIFFFIIIAAASADSHSSNSGSSCPYAYAFDGDHYVMDAEPLSGAITRGLERDDLCLLEHVRPSHGAYELMLRNELKETQYLDRIQLRVVDHPRGSTVCTDINGGLHAVTNLAAPTAAHDETGTDFRAVLKSSDHIPWQSMMPTDDSWRDVPLRNELTFTFSRKHGAPSANLVVDAATSQWGSVMMREMMQARGDRLDDWYASVDAHGPALGEMIRFNQREELYFLKVYVREGDEWVQRGWIPGGSPSASELKAIPLDLSGVEGDTVTVRVQPPCGFWSLDYVAMSYDELPVPQSVVVPAKTAMTNDHVDITPTIKDGDGRYYEMKHVGDAAHITFAALPTPAGGERSVFLDARGYYHAQIDETRPEQTALIADMLEHNGAVVRYSLQRFAELVERGKAMP